ncbi:hypothetical protein E4U09_004591 [Claviceps aff. purpurea]|uniref:Fungal-type protein kinase domain-containing protein n=1 Tax=Claviceps aff. purpurea TaxID=1967640 RepID=A0A9P7QEW4_9HYPO|nr:hypothetical protein E4U09_004591 [Claviceps aff. purpurea]
MVVSILRRLSNLSSQTPPTPTFRRAVLDLVDALNPPPAPKTLPHEKFISTPRAETSPKSNSSAAGEDHAVVAAKKDKHFDEVKNSLFRAVDGFWEKFFGTSRREIDSLDRHQIHKNLLKEHRKGKWKRFPNNAKEHSVLKWLFGLERTYLQSAPNKIHTTKDEFQFEEKRVIEKGLRDKYTFKNTGVVGELKEQYYTGKFKEDFLQMALLVRSIFCAQPTRRYVHAFMLCGRMMELWIFDRSGAYSSGLARALISYAAPSEVS